MSQRRVLIVANEFPPMGGGGVMRAAKFAKYLPEFGWQPYVITCDYLGNSDLLDRELEQEVLRAGVHVKAVPSLDPNRLKVWLKRGLRERKPLTVGKSAPAATPKPILYTGLQKLKQRLEGALLPDRHLLWTWPATAAARRLIQQEGIETVLTTSPPPSTHLIGLALKRAFPHLRWIADFRDLWSLSPGIEAAFPWVQAQHRRMEAQVLTCADEAIFVSEPILAKTRAAFDLPEDKGTVITNGFDAADFQGVSVDETPRFTVSYLGSIFGVRTQNRLIEGIRRFVEGSGLGSKEVRFHFIGSFDPAYHRAMRPLAESGILQETAFVSHETALQHMVSSDVLVLILPVCEESRIAYTGKFFEYMASGRPILALVPEGCVSAVVRDLGIGTVVSPDDPVAIAEALGTYYRLFRQRTTPRLVTAASGIERFERRDLTRRLAELLAGRRA